MTSNANPKIIFVLGGPGAGKGTECFRLVRDFGFCHLSAGDLLREERNKPDSESGELIEECIRNGKIVPAQTTVQLIKRAKQRATSDTFLIDGFSRNEDNVSGWMQEMADETELLFVLVLDCQIETCIQRCLKRGDQGSGRTDDNIETVRKRILTFIEETLPILEYYEKLNLVRRVDSSRSPDAVHEDVKNLLFKK